MKCCIHHNYSCKHITGDIDQQRVEKPFENTNVICLDVLDCLKFSYKCMLYGISN